ncbi:Retrovirus-related Pol polyprotein from transposon TNT 1-94 [Gossypium australe]|uniref:Retrovirus-related Pol polyprotein from transposon TNT 1-94 n=1 Tax=Gossypium australe TaxID=47621 RepID=A0A5B6VVX1_9ROSI|nr:Retrovirus-related Pol polyprotein from transposon TNT 1-94 [Gossypium australe]
MLFFMGEPNLVCRLRESFYSLKQSPRAWFEHFSVVIKKFGMKLSEVDHSVFYCHNNYVKCIYLVVYMDDIAITGDNHEGFAKLKNFLGIKVAWSKKKGIIISQ